jgi:3-hydroxyacyl-CoA dehydrogenase / enoyl-CoA hydratase / 3-hydroxybutyryl-CoA epimerase / enoyl-CoA isomerase
MRFGMPMSPLELIDLIGIRTAFDSGRVFWQSFPKRIDPAPILPGMIKAGRLGAEFGGGFFAPQASGQRGGNVGAVSAEPRPLHPDAIVVIERYQRGQRGWSEDEALLALALPMWIEAAEILVHGVVDSLNAIELGLRGGLGFRRPDGFFAFFDSQGADKLSAILDQFADQASLAAPEYLRDPLRIGTLPSDAVLRYVAHLRDSAETAAAGGAKP